MEDKCKTCIYRASSFKYWKCEYILIVGHSRPCAPGNECTEYKKGNRIKIPTSIIISPKIRSADETWLDKFWYPN